MPFLLSSLWALTAAGDRQPADGRSLREEVEAGYAADRQLARDLGRAEPRRVTAPGGYVDTLGHRPALTAGLERELVELAQSGDARARAHLIGAYMPLIANMARTYRSGQVQ